MPKNEHEVVIDCPTERVFEFVTDMSAWSQWHGSGEGRKTTPGPVGVGTVWEIRGQVQGRTIEAELEVTSYEPNSRFGFKAISGPIDVQQAFTFEPVAGGTRLTTVLDLADPELAAPARKQWDKDLLILKELLEARA